MTEHLPIQRWKKIFTRYPASEVLPNENGEYVTYADHVAALRACEARVREDERSSNFTPDDHSNGMTEAYQRGLDAAREAVEAIPAPYKIRGDFETYAHYSEGKADFKDAALSAIDALRQGSND